ncbi:hypothetical protein Tco_1334482 [Tanacetum coccineum]
MKILSVVSVNVNKQFGYGNLQEIVVRRAVQKLYTFKEGDFLNLHLNDIEDMLLLHVQKKLFNLYGDDIAAKLQVRIQQRHAKEKIDRQGLESDIHHGESDQQVAVRKKDHAKLGKIGRWRES